PLRGGAPPAGGRPAAPGAGHEARSLIPGRSGRKRRGRPSKGAPSGRRRAADPDVAAKPGGGTLVRTHVIAGSGGKVTPVTQITELASSVRGEPDEGVSRCRRWGRSRPARTRRSEACGPRT